MRAEELGFPIQILENAFSSDNLNGGKPSLIKIC